MCILVVVINLLIRESESSLYWEILVKLLAYFLWVKVQAVLHLILCNRLAKKMADSKKTNICLLTCLHLFIWEFSIRLPRERKKRTVAFRQLWTRLIIVFHVSTIFSFYHRGSTRLRSQSFDIRLKKNLELEPGFAEICNRLIIWKQSWISYSHLTENWRSNQSSIG